MRARDGLVCPVTALSFVTAPDALYLCAGVGPYLHVYRTPTRSQSETAAAPELCRTVRLLPDGSRIHAIEASHVRVAENVDNPATSATLLTFLVRGGRYVVSLTLHLSHLASAPEQHSVKPQAREPDAPVLRRFREWVLAASTTARNREQPCRVIVSLASGTVVVCDRDTLRDVCRVTAPVREIFWSSMIAHGCLENVLVGHGSSFGRIVLWRFGIADGDTQHGTKVAMLHSHDGPVMDIRCSDLARPQWLVSASVDRTVRLWKAVQRSGSETPSTDPLYEPCAVLYGHTARVWQVAFADIEATTNVPGKLPSLFSTGEDRTLRLWHPQHCAPQARSTQNHQPPPHVYHGHAGRNVWCVAVAGTDESCMPGNLPNAMVATGGDDGLIQMRTVSLETDHAHTDARCELASGREEPLNTHVGGIDGVDIGFPRQSKEGGADEAVQAVAFLATGLVLVSTSYGRVLCGAPSQPDAGPDAKWDWSVVFGEPETTFAPNALLLLGPYVYVGTTDGRVICIQVVGESWLEVLRFSALRRETGLVVGVFGAGSEISGPQRPDQQLDLAAKSCDDVFVADLDGALHHWSVSHGSATDRVAASYRATYRIERAVRNAVVTAVFVEPFRGLVFTGDRRGYLHAYRLVDLDAAEEYRAFAGDAEGCAENATRRLVAPLGFCRPHKDRLSHMTRRAGEDAASEALRLRTCGFDGAIADIIAEVGAHGNGVESTSESPRELEPTPDADPEPAEPSFVIRVEKTTRCAERLETLIKVVQPVSRSGKVLDSRPIVVGFRSSQLVVWDVEQRVLILRADVGGWRRAFDIRLHPRAVDGDRGSAAVDLGKCSATYWRAGVLRKVDCEHATAVAIGTGFHGLRAHGAVLIGDRREVLTCGEDTCVRVTRLVDDASCGNSESARACRTESSPPWRHVQVMDDHTSGVCAVSATSFEASVAADGAPERSAPVGYEVALSGGGMDELFMWARPTMPGSAWVRVALPKRRAAPDRAAPVHRILCLDLAPSLGGAACVVGRSDGSVELATVTLEAGGLALRVSAKGHDRHAGAVLCVSSVSCAGERVAAAGDTAGAIRLWAVGSESLSSLCEPCVGAHRAGTNDVALVHITTSGGGGQRGILIVSAGDDELVCARVACVVRDAPQSHAAWADPGEIVYNFGAAAVGCVVVGRAANAFVVAALGADQQLVLARVRVGCIGDGAPRVCGVDILNTRTIDIADPAGLIVVDVRASPGTGSVDTVVQLLVHGYGLQVVSMNVQCAVEREGALCAA